MNRNIPLFEISWGRGELINAVDSITRGRYWAKGPYVDEFESELEEYFDVAHAIVVNSGTTALVAALRALGIAEGDEVIVPSMTFVATANAVRLVGAEPVFADIETETYGLDADRVRSRVTDRTAAILPVHLYGGPCRVDELRDVAEEFGLAVLEDAAEAFGATFGGEYVGTLGDVGVYSFCQNKVLTTGEGGAVVTDDDDIARQIRLYRSHGRKEGDYFEQSGSGEYTGLGTNIRMSDLTAAIGCAQLERIGDLIAGRRAAAERLSNALSEVPGVSVPKTHPRGTHVYQLYTVEFDPDVDQDAVVEILDEEGIDSKVYWDTPVHRTKYYTETTGTTPELPRTEELADRVLSLPMYPELSPDVTDRIATVLAERLDEAR